MGGTKNTPPDSEEVAALRATMYKFDEERFAAVNALTAERARSAALMAELQFVADRTHEDESPLDDDDTALLHARALIFLSQSPTSTEKKT